jgi:serine/threonine protein kinase
MTPEVQERVEELLDGVLGLEPQKRSAYLAQACPDAPELRAEVESLLTHHEQGERQGFLGRDEGQEMSGEPREQGVFLVPHLSPVAPQEEADETLLEQSIGPYKVHSLLGRGGFSAVYLAVRNDGQYQGKVAIKVLKRGLDTDDILRRFLNERQTLAALKKHPNIVTLFDGGSTPDGRPYFVMEYVDGKPIDRYCDDHKLSIDERLRIFRTICSAVHYAHKNLIVHRDLKPANVLVTAKDEHGHHGVRLLDFGIAKLLNPELSSQTIVPTAPWQRFLTPQYASPEQVRGDPINVTSDVYSLGVFLYELLTGHLPYHFSANRSDIEQVICAQEPAKPSTKIATTEELTTSAGTVVTVSPAYVGTRRKSGPTKLRRKLAGDLDNIVLKAMQKDPERRYASVYELSQDIQNYLEGDPVLARGNPFGYRAGKFVWRHKGKFGIAAAVFVAVACLAGWALFERSQALGEAEAGRQRAEQATATAKALEVEVGRQRALVERDLLYLADFAKEYLAEQRAGATPEVRQALDRIRQRIQERKR